MWRFGGSVAQFSRKAGCVRREIGECDGPAAFGYNGAGWSVALEGIVEPHGLVRDEFSEDVGSKDLCE